MSETNIVVTITQEAPITVTMIQETPIIVTVGAELLAPTNHDGLDHLDYDHSGHTGFQKKIIYDDDLGSFIFPE